MIGQGSPSSLASTAARHPGERLPPVCARVRWFVVGACLVACWTWAAPLLAQDRLLESPARVRIAWGGGEATAWSGRIVLEGGTFADMQLLGMEADAPGTVWLENEHTLRVHSGQPHRFDGVDVTITPDGAPRLTAELSESSDATPLKTDVVLAEAMRKPYRMVLDTRGNDLVVQRSPSDALRIETDRDLLVFSPGEQFSFVVRPVLEEIEPSTSIDVETTLSPARGGEAVWQDQQRLPVPVSGDASTTLHLPLPEKEGAYVVRVKIMRPTGYRKGFFPGREPEQLAQREFQLVVLDKNPEATAAKGEWVQVLEIDPANPHWWQRLPDWTQVGRIPGVPQRPLGSIPAGAVNHPLGPFIELPPTVGAEEPHWQAYPLPVKKTGVPYLLEVQYPADQEQHFGLSIVEPNAVGQVMPIGRDTGVYVEGLGRGELKERHTQRVVFWPRTNSPLLLVTNQHPTAPARFGNIRVWRRKGSLAEESATQPWRSAPRLVAAYVGRPLLPETFGASEGVDPFSGQSVDDWQTFFESATRLADYLRYAGYNAAAVNVMADGSTIFPSQRLLPTPLYNTGRMAAGSNDLPPADPLELLLRVFDREELALLPSLQFAAPLPELEALRREANPQSSGLEWVGADGRTWPETYGTQRGLAAYYNLLDERVQESLLGIVRELIQRYGQHSSLAGIAVQLSATGYGQLPGLEWGLDDATVARFERDTGIHLADDGPDRFAARQTALTGEHAEAWRNWRAARVTEFYSRLASLVRSTDPRRRLVLTTEEMFASPALNTQLRPSVLAKTRIDRLMLDAGIDRQQLLDTKGVEICPTRYVGSAVPLADRAVDLELNDAFSALTRRAADAPASAAMFYHRPRRQRLASFDAKSPFKSYTLLVTESSADDAAARKPYAIALADQMPGVILDGGELLPMGQEDATRHVLEIVEQLPTHATVDVHRQQPVTVRTFGEPQQKTIVVVNECPWTADVEVVLDVPSQAVMKPLVGASVDAVGGLTRTFEAGSQVWSLRVAPYDVEAVRFDQPGVKVTELRATVSAEAQHELQLRMTDLGNRDLTAPRVYQALANPSFEPAGAEGPLPGWKLVGPQATAELDATTPRVGKTCLYLGNRGTTAAVESNTFATPPTGQLIMTLFVRGENVGPNTQLRLVFETVRGNQTYRRFTTVGGARAGAPGLDAQWHYYAFGVNDLPLDSQGQMLVKFELVGQGEVWIDDVQLFDLLFPLSFYENSHEERLELVKLITAAQSAYQAGRLTDCVRLLESYWPRFVVSYTPLVQPTVVQQPPPTPQEETPAEEPAEKPAPSIGESLKEYILFWR